MENKNKELIAEVESRLKYHKRCTTFNWYVYNIFMIVSFIGAILIPFGMAAKLYKPVFASHTNIDFWIIIISFISLTLQVLILSQKLRERSVRARKIYYTLKDTLTKYKYCSMTDIELHTKLEQISKLQINEET